MKHDWRRRASLRAWALVALAFSGIAGAGLAQPANDECATPNVLVNGSNPILTNIGATTNGADPLFSCAPTVNDVWFTYTPTCSGVVILSMCPPSGAAGLDAVMEAYSGTCGSLVSLGCDDDGCGTVGSGSIVVVNGVTLGVPIIVRVGSFATPGNTGNFTLNVSCVASLVDDFGDAPGAATVARHTNALGGERLGLNVTAEAIANAPAWFGDAGDDGIVSVANLFPGSTTAQLVVSARNTFATATSFCRAWVDRDQTIGWSNFTDAFPSQTAVVGASPVNFTFGPFTMSAATPPSPFVRIRLASNTAGVAAATGTGALGEVEDYVLPGTGGPTSGAAADAGDAPLPYPPCNSTFIASERLGSTVSADASAPVGFPGSAGTAAFDDDTDDDGIVRIEGLAAGGSCSITLTAVDPAGTFVDNFRAWLDFDGDGVWDEAGESFATVAANVGTVPVQVTLGPIPVPAGTVNPVPARMKLSFGGQGASASGAPFIYGEVEDYLLPVGVGTGCNTTPGPAPSIYAEDPPRQAGSFTWKGSAHAPLVPVSFILSATNFLPGGIDVSIFLPGIVPPATCFLYVGLTTIAPMGVADAAGDVSLTVAVPPGTAGATLYLQDFQIAPPFVLYMTPALPVTILP